MSVPQEIYDAMTERCRRLEYERDDWRKVAWAATASFLVLMVITITLVAILA